MSRTLGQQRAEFCLKQLEALSCDAKKFKNFSAGLPSLILQNGFGQALAFLVAKGEDKHRSAFNIIFSWLVEQKLLTADRPAEMLKQISQMSQSSYLHAQKETLSMLEWLKRYANAELFG